MRTLYSLGDSFSVGVGLNIQSIPQATYAGILASQHNMSLSLLGRAGCDMFTIYLQVRKLIKLSVGQGPLAIISLTWPNRYSFATEEVDFLDVDLKNVDYLSYTPYRDALAINPGLKPGFDFTSSPKIFSNTLLDINGLLKGQTHNKDGMQVLSREQKKALEYYITYLHNDHVKREQDTALAVYMHILLKQANIPHVFLDPVNYFYTQPEKDTTNSIEEKYFIPHNWYDFSHRYPDEQGTSHINEEGHKVVAGLIQEHFNKHNLFQEWKKPLI